MNYTDIDYKDYLPSVYNYTTSTISNSFITSAKITGVLAGVTGIATLLVGTALIPPALAFSSVWCVTFLGAKTVSVIFKKVVSDAVHSILIESLGDSGEKIADVVDIAVSTWVWGYQDVSVSKFVNFISFGNFNDEFVAQLNHIKFLGNINGLLFSSKKIVNKYIHIEESECLGKYWSTVYINVFKNSDSVLIDSIMHIMTKGFDNYQSMLGSIIIAGLIDYSFYHNVCEQYQGAECNTTEIIKVVEAPKDDYNLLDGLKVGFNDAADFTLNGM